MPMFPIPYMPSNHEKKFIEHFGNAGVSLKRNLLRDGLVTYIICFTNRCGSHLLAELISTNAKFGLAGEYLIADGALKTVRGKNLKSLHDYLMWLRRERASKAGIFGIKLAYQQLFFLARTGLMPEAFGDVRFIHIRRTNVLGQAVSLAIAAQTGSWTSKQVRQLDSANGACNEADIVRIMNRIHEANAKFRCFFDVYGIRPVEVTYEELENDLRSTGDRVIRELGFPGTSNDSVSPESITLRKQRNRLNDVFVEQIRKKYNAFGNNQPQVGPIEEVR